MSMSFAYCRMAVIVPPGTRECQGLRGERPARAIAERT
jgi:hypothetical protein